MVMTADGIRFWIYYYDTSSKLWVQQAGNWLEWTPGPNSISVKRKVEWKAKSSGTKQLKVFKFKGRQVGTMTLKGKVGTILYTKLEYLSLSKIVVDVRAQYVETGGTRTYWPLISPITPYLGVSTPVNITDPTTLPLTFETSSFFIITSIAGAAKEYAVMDHPTGNYAKRENVIDATVVLERVDTGKITPTTAEW